MTLILLTILLVIMDYHFRWKNEQWKYAVHTDAYFYNRYLPMIFINHKLDNQTENPMVIKYYVGTSLLYLPFFALAYAGSYFLGLPADGYSILFPVFISIGTLFYLISGFCYFNKFLSYYNISPWIKCFIFGVMTFGTTAFYYVVNAPGWAHICAFALICFLMYHLKKMVTDFHKTSIPAIIAGLSILFFTRPTDITILLIAPFLALNFKNLQETFRRILVEKKTILTGMLLAFIPLACQLGIYKAYTGHFFIWSYKNEGFNFTHPELMKVLFGYAKGFFVYTPICFLSLFGLIPLYKMNRRLFSGIIIYLSLTIYLISSWWCWNYGSTFGPRAFIEHYPVFFFLLALIIQVNGRLLKITLITFSMLLCALNLFQVYQSLCGILDHDFKTNSKGYWNVFLSTQNGYSGKFYRFPVDETEGNIVGRKCWFNDMEKTDSTWLNPTTKSPLNAHSGRFSSEVNKNNCYSIGLRKNLSELRYAKNVVIRVSGWFLVSKKGSGSFFVMCFKSKGDNLNYNTFNLDGYMLNTHKWEYQVFEMYMPKFTKTIENEHAVQAEFYYFNNSPIDCFVDDLKIEFIEFKKMDRVLDLNWNEGIL